MEMIKQRNAESKIKEGGVDEKLEWINPLFCTIILIAIFSCVVRNGKMDLTQIGGGGVVHEDKEC